MTPPENDLTRREFVGFTVGAAGVSVSVAEGAPAANTEGVACSLTINRQRHDLSIEPRVTLLDLLRERLHLTGSKKKDAIMANVAPARCSPVAGASFPASLLQ